MSNARWWNRKRFDLAEVALVSIVIAFVGFVATRPPATIDEGAVLEQKYGPGHFSANAEEWIVRDFFNDRRGGFFVDVGAGHYASLSNTYYIERMLGWSGLAIDALQDLKPDYDAHRSRSRFLAFFISDVSGDTTKMYTHGGKFAGTSSDRTFVERFGDNPSELTVPTITLNDLLEREKVDRIDFLSMDIELSEPKALAGFDIDRYRPSLVCIEAHPEVRQAILDYFARHDYVVLGKYLRVDEGNLYFAPLARQQP